MRKSQKYHEFKSSTDLQNWYQYCDGRPYETAKIRTIDNSSS